MYHWTPPPASEQTQDAWWNFPYGPLPNPSFDSGGTHRSNPAEPPFKEHDPVLGGWWQGDRRLKNFKPRHYFTRPSDGKRPGSIGRLKDALTGEGADVFITSSGDKRTLMRDRPQRWQWTKNPGLGYEKWLEHFGDKDWRPQDFMPIRDAPWTEGKHGGKVYNFRHREFEQPRPWWFWWPENDRVWVDARWSQGAKHASRSPLSKKLVSGAWQSRVPFDAGVEYPWHLRGRAGGRFRGDGRD